MPPPPRRSPLYTYQNRSPNRRARLARTGRAITLRAGSADPLRTSVRGDTSGVRDGSLPLAHLSLPHCSTSQLGVQQAGQIRLQIDPLRRVACFIGLIRSLRSTAAKYFPL